MANNYDYGIFVLLSYFNIAIVKQWFESSKWILLYDGIKVARSDDKGYSLGEHWAV